MQFIGTADPFIWMVRKEGYGIFGPEEASTLFGDQCKAEEGPWIGPAMSPKKAFLDWRTYAPLRDHTALFRTFIDLDCSSESIVNFANRFGLLKDAERGEPIATWETAIATMRPAVLLWEENRTSTPPKTSDDPVASGSVEAAWVEWFGAVDSNVRVELLTRLTRTLRASEPVESGVDRSLRLTNTSPFTAFNVKYHYIPQVLAANINQNIEHVRPVFGSHPLRNCLRLRLVPTNLLEAMWLQFGQAAESSKPLRKCPQCESWFELSPKAARADKVFCSGACKAKAYRRRLDKR